MRNRGYCTHIQQVITPSRSGLNHFQEKKEKKEKVGEDVCANTYEPGSIGPSPYPLLYITLLSRVDIKVGRKYAQLLNPRTLPFVMFSFPGFMYDPALSTNMECISKSNFLSLKFTEHSSQCQVKSLARLNFICDFRDYSCRNNL